MLCLYACRPVCLQCGGLGLIKALPGVHVPIGVNTLVHEQFTSLLAWLILCCDLESLGFVVCYELVQRCQQELGNVYKPELTLGEGYVLFRVVGDTGDATLHF